MMNSLCMDFVAGTTAVNMLLPDKDAAARFLPRSHSLEWPGHKYRPPVWQCMLSCTIRNACATCARKFGSRPSFLSCSADLEKDHQLNCNSHIGVLPQRGLVPSHVGGGAWTLHCMIWTKAMWSALLALRSWFQVPGGLPDENGTCVAVFFHSHTIEIPSLGLMCLAWTA